jgi:Raf kinase inhibitor-like YbhB/YbcL family protein
MPDARVVEPDTAPADTAFPDASAMSIDAPVADGPFAISSPVVKAGGTIPKMYMCRNENVSPPLDWTPGPAGTKSYAVTMIHTPSWHWVLWDIPVTTLSLPMGVATVAEPPVPAGSKQNRPNIDCAHIPCATWYGHTGPCPNTSSTYDYAVWALDVEKLPGVTTAMTSKQITDVIKAHMVGRAQMTVAATR